MNPQWRHILGAEGAEIDADDRVSLPGALGPETANPGECNRFELSHLGLIAVRGEEADSFLQGQITNDIRELSPTHSQLAGHCSHKGRMLSNFRLLRLDDGIYLQLPRERVADTLQRLRLFVLRARVTLEDASDVPVRIGVAGDCTPGLLERLGLPIPTGDGDLTQIDGVWTLRLPSPWPRFELIGPVDTLAEIWGRLTGLTQPGSTDLWALYDIRAGIPTIYRETADAFVPQMANMQLIDGVSFHKGCYTGQEVVARSQYLGKQKRRMYWAEVRSDTAPRPGDALHGTASTSEQATGRVVDACPVGPGRYELLAVAESAAVQSGDVHLGDGGPLVSLRPPPYGFPSDRAEAPGATSPADGED